MITPADIRPYLPAARKAFDREDPVCNSGRERFAHALAFMQAHAAASKPARFTERTKEGFYRDAE